MHVAITPAGREKREYADCGLRTGTPEEWFEDLRAFLLSWVEDRIKNRSVKPEGAIAGGEVDPIAVEAYRLLRERFAPLARFAGPLFAGGYSRGDTKGTLYVTQLRQWLCVPETAGEFRPDDAILSDDASGRKYGLIRRRKKSHLGHTSSVRPVPGAFGADQEPACVCSESRRVPHR